MDDRIYQKVLSRAFSMLAARSRSISDLRGRLLEKPWATEDAVARAIARLLELGFLNDLQFAEQYVNSRLAVKPLGRARLRRDLQQKHISAGEISRVLEEAYGDGREDQLIDLAISRRLRLRGKPESHQDTRKLLEHLVRLGFSYDLAFQRVRAIAIMDESAEA